YFFQNLSLQSFALHIGNHLGADFAEIAVKQSDYYGFALCAAASFVASLLLFVHILFPAADESLINLYRAAAADFSLPPEPAGLHGKPDAMQHEPRTLLSNANCFSKFIGTNAILAACQQPCSREPLLKSDGRIF